MSADAWLWIVAALMALHLAIGLPLFAVLGLGSIGLILVSGQYTVSVLGELPFQAMDSFALLAMPLFILTGDVVSSGRMARAIVGLGQSLVGWMKGGLGMTTIAACFIFSGTSGSNSADTAAVGRIMIPRLSEQGYPVGYAAALAAAGGCMGIIVPPSIVFIIYGVITSTSVGDLFLAGIVPGLVMAACLCLANYLYCSFAGWTAPAQPFRIREVGRTLWNSKFALGAPAVILAGIYSGIFTPTEAAAVAVAYCIFIETVVNRAVSVRQLPSLFLRSGMVIGVLGPIIVFSILFGEVLSVLRIPERLAGHILTFATSRDTALLSILALLLIVGCFLEVIGALIILMPVLLPVAIAFQIDPVHLGVFVVCALTIGFITPPVGLNLFVASSVSGVPIMNVAHRVWPLLIGLVVATVAVGWLPGLSLWFRGAL
jgi:C4-dicarboxylate transporter DctM subunit